MWDLDLNKWETSKQGYRRTGGRCHPVLGPRVSPAHVGVWPRGVSEVGVLSRGKGSCQGLGAALPPAQPGWGSQGCRAVARGRDLPAGRPLIKRGLGWEPGGQPRPWAFLWGRSQPWRSEKGAGGHPSLEPMGASSRDCLDSGTASPCPPVSLCRRTDKDPGQHPCPWCPTSFLFSSRIRAPPAHMRSEVRAGLQGPVHHPPVPEHSQER